MSNTPAPESAPEAGTQTPPTPALSSPSSGSSSPSGQTAPPVDADALVEKMLAHPKFKSQLSGAVQSVKDKRFSEIERIKTYLDNAKGDVALARREMLMDEVESKLLAGENVGNVPANHTTTSPFEQQTADLLREAGIPLDDPEVKAMSAKQYASEADWFRDITRLGIARAKGQAPAPNGAIVGVSGQAITTPDRETQRDQLTTKLAELQKHPSKNWQEINEISLKLEKLVRPT